MFLELSKKGILEIREIVFQFPSGDYFYVSLVSSSLSMMIISHLSIPFWGLFLCFELGLHVLTCEGLIFQFPSGDYFYVSKVGDSKWRVKKSFLSIPFWGLFLCFVIRYAKLLMYNDTNSFQFPSGDYFYVSDMDSYTVDGVNITFNSLLGIISMFPKFMKVYQ